MNAYKTVIIIGFLFLSTILWSQNNLGKSNDLGRISLTPVVPDQSEEIPKHATNLLENKLRQIASRNGLGSSSINPDFIITAVVNVLSKDIVPSAPPMVAMNLEFTFLIVDYRNKTIFSSTYIEKKGVGQNDTKAYINAIKGIKPNNKNFKRFVDSGKEKIIEYYNSNCDFIIKEAEAHAATKDYEHALFNLMSIPKVCKECYWSAMQIVPSVFEQYQNSICLANLTKANAAWSSHDAQQAAHYLGLVPGDSKCHQDAMSLMLQIETKLSADEQKEWDNMLLLQKRKFELLNKKIEADAHVEALRIKAYQDVAKSYYSNTNHHVVHYDLGFLY